MAIETKTLNCICCPLGCEITATLEDGAVTGVKGNTCPRGAKYAREELTAPQRMLTTTVRIAHGRLPLLPVVSAKALPKDKVLACAEALRRVTVQAPVRAGEVIVPDILGLGVDMVASRDMERA